MVYTWFIQFFFSWNISCLPLLIGNLPKPQSSLVQCHLTVSKTVIKLEPLEMLHSTCSVDLVINITKQLPYENAWRLLFLVIASRIVFLLKSWFAFFFLLNLMGNTGCVTFHVFLLMLNSRNFKVKLVIHKLQKT